MKEHKIDISAFGLHLLAMGLMLCDHVWATVAGDAMWLTHIGRLAFPIFAFLLAEGFVRTGNRKKYLLRLLAAAVLSEIPFDLMYAGTAFYPYHQNVIWTFIIAFLCMWAIDAVYKKKGRIWGAAMAVLMCIAGLAAGTVFMVDYYGAGVLTVLVFYIFRERKIWVQALLLAAMWWINCELLGGEVLELSLFGHSVEIYEQGLALLSLIPIWLYRGRQGVHSRWTRALNYGFYPVHMLVLYLLSQLAYLA